MPELPCRIQPLKQISVSQAGAEVNRDLEQLFAAVNQLAVCVGKIADYLNTSSRGGFSDGNGPGNGGGGAGGLGTGIANPRGLAQEVIRISTSGTYSVPVGFMGVLMVDPTADLTVVLCPPEAGKPITIMHVGSANVVTVQDDLGANLAPVINAGGWTTLMPKEDSSNARTWPAGAVTQYPNGVIAVQERVIIAGATKGFGLQAPNGKYFDITVDNTGALVTTFIGNTLAIAVAA